MLENSVIYDLKKQNIAALHVYLYIYFLCVCMKIITFPIIFIFKKNKLTTMTKFRSQRKVSTQAKNLL